MKLKGTVSSLGEITMRDYTNKDGENKSIEVQTFILEGATDSVEFELSGKKAGTLKKGDEVVVEFNIKNYSGISKKTDKPYSMNTFKVVNVEVQEEDMPF